MKRPRKGRFGPRGGFDGGSGDLGFGAGGTAGAERNFDRKASRERSARSPRLRRFLARGFFLEPRKREITRRTVGMKVGTSSGGSSGTSPSLSVAVRSVAGGRAASSICRKREATAACSAAMS